MPTPGQSPMYRTSNDASVAIPRDVLSYVPFTPQWWGYQVGEAVVPGQQFQGAFTEGGTFEPLIQPGKELASDLGGKLIVAGAVGLTVVAITGLVIGAVLWQTK